MDCEACRVALLHGCDLHLATVRAALIRPGRGVHLRHGLPGGITMEARYPNVVEAVIRAGPAAML